MPRWNSRSAPSSRIVIAITGVPRIWMIEAAYMPQQNRGIRVQVIPGARIVWIVTRKLSPVRIEEKPAMKMPTAVTTTQPFE
jgi:hypothetical protein